MKGKKGKLDKKVETKVLHQNLSIYLWKIGSCFLVYVKHF